ncbi:Aste57867_24130 [Aphanomyces stellatus]|uniref:Aste57867_24130 protein n=1 Tax=Aphanomyces stellatus TaxID=120398 RepID=A0A485LPK7_9STRA|nr:hypothetical protein As57867_024056 [Aphanomyces stellatus]VFU00772.1 Aste57867_24130 [Aphanomyces stellatus]
MEVAPGTHADDVPSQGTPSTHASVPSSTTKPSPATIPHAETLDTPQPSPSIEPSTWGQPLTFNDFAPPPSAMGRPLSLGDFAPPPTATGGSETFGDFAPPMTAQALPLDCDASGLVVVGQPLSFDAFAPPPIGQPLSFNDFAPAPRHLPPLDGPLNSPQFESMASMAPVLLTHQDQSFAGMPDGFAQPTSPNNGNVFGEDIARNMNTEQWGSQESLLDAAVWTTENTVATSLPPIPDNEPPRLTTAAGAKRPETRQKGSPTKADMISLAKKKAMAERLGAGKSFMKTTMQDISDLGTGIHLYFIFTKYMGVCFLVMSLLALPALIMNVTGHGFETDMIDPMRFCTLSIANLGVNSTMNATTQWCLDNPFTQDPNYVSYITTAFDILFSLAFVGFIAFFNMQIRTAVHDQGDNVTPAKYAIFVRGLPPSATPEQILAHFNALYDPTKPRTIFPMYLGCWGKPYTAKTRAYLTHGGHLSKPVADVEYAHGDEMYLGKWVASVHITHNSGGLLRTFLAMEDLTAKAAELADILTTYKGRTPKKGDEQAIPRLEKQHKKIQDRLVKKTAKMKQLRKQQATAGGGAALHDCNGAFVVFNCVESQRRCIHDYRNSTKMLGHHFQPKALRFQGLHRLIVVPAPEPSDVIWENLEVSARERRLRRYFTNFIAFLLLLLSCGIISIAQSEQQQFAKQQIQNFCSEAVPAIFAGSYDAIANNTWYFEWNKFPDPGVCDDRAFFLSYTNGMNASLPSVTNAHACRSPCLSTLPSLDQTCHTLPCFKPNLATLRSRTCATYEASDVLQCYCEPRLKNAIKLYGIIDGPKKMYKTEVPCQAYLTAYLEKNGAIVLAASVVIVVNLFLQTVLRAFGDFERHISESDFASTLVIKLFFAQMLNTGVIVLLVNANWSNVPLPVGLDAILHGTFKDFVQQWYIAVGVGIATTMLVNTVAPQVAPTLQMFVIYPIMEWFGTQFAVTQKQMNEVYAGPPFDISLRYPLVLNTVFVTMMYCGGIPILLPIASVACFVTYACDKLTLMRLYSVRTAYDEALGQLAASLLPFALLIHLGFSTWMYGNNQFLQSNLLDVTWILGQIGYDHVGNATDVNDAYAAFQNFVAKYDPLKQDGLSSKIFRTNVFPIFFFFVVAFVSIFLSKFVGALLWPILDKTLGLVLRLLSLLGTSAVTTLKHKLSRRKYSKDDATIPQYPDFAGLYEKFTDPALAVDTARGYVRLEGSVVIRKWLMDTPTRDAGDRMRTYEAFAAPVKSYEIAANPKYRNAVEELSKARERMKSSAVAVVDKPATDKGTKASAVVVPM